MFSDESILWSEDWFGPLKIDKLGFSWHFLSISTPKHYRKQFPKDVKMTEKLRTIDCTGGSTASAIVQ